MRPLAGAMAEAADKISTCNSCGNVDAQNPCHICAAPGRDQSTICVVQEVGDLWAMERAGAFRGQYHVLGGTLSALDCWPHRTGESRRRQRSHSRHERHSWWSDNSSLHYRSFGSCRGYRVTSCSRRPRRRGARLSRWRDYYRGHEKPTSFLAYAVFLGWDALTILVLYWLESVIMGVLNIPKILACRSTEQSASGAALSNLFPAVFFTFHYGMFTSVHGVFLAEMFGARPIMEGLFSSGSIIWTVKTAIDLIAHKREHEKGAQVTA